MARATSGSTACSSPFLKRGRSSHGGAALGERAPCPFVRADDGLPNANGMGARSPNSIWAYLRYSPRREDSNSKSSQNRFRYRFIHASHRPTTHRLQNLGIRFCIATIAIFCRLPRKVALPRFCQAQDRSPVQNLYWDGKGKDQPLGGGHYGDCPRGFTMRRSRGSGAIRRDARGFPLQGTPHTGAGSRPPSRHCHLRTA